MASRALVIGLDCAPPQLVFDRWLDELPTIRALTERGTFGVLRSCDPPITVPAWSVMTSSRNPGALGFYGFRNRRDHSYDGLAFANSRSVKVPRVWDLLSARGQTVVVLGVPQTYPVTPVNGVMVACFLTPDTSRQYTYPDEVKGEIEDLVGDYMVDVPNFRTDDKERLLADLEEMTEKRFRVAEHLLETRPWDLFFMVEMGTDRIHHGFWRFTDPEHRLYEPGNPYEGAMLDYYRRLDAKIARLLRFADDDTAVLLVSDHGAKRIDGGICVNEWLRREGYLALREEPEGPARLTPDMIDWPRTVAWGEGGYYCRLFLNVEGPRAGGNRSAGGVRARPRASSRRSSRRSATRRGARSARSPTGRKTSIRCGTGSRRISWCTSATSTGGALARSARAPSTSSRTTPARTTRTMRTRVSTCSPATAPGMAGRGPERDLRDVAPTLLRLLGEPVPAEMEGTSLV